jgi:hypothetical protein
MTAVGVAALFATAGRGWAGVTLYYDRSTFNAAITGSLDFDSFEGSPVGGSASLARPGYTVSEVNGSASAIATGPMGTLATHGSSAAQYHDDVLSKLVFSFNSSINAFGFDISAGPGDHTISVEGGASGSFALAEFTPTFFGVIDDSGTFNTLSFDVSGTGSVVFDSVSYGSTTLAAVPEPSTFVLGLVGAGLAGAGCWWRRRRAA